MYGKKLSLKPALPVLILLKIKRLALFFLNSLPPFAAASAFCIWNVSLACRPVLDQWINSCLCQSLHHRPSKSVCLSQDLLTAALGWGLNVQRVIDQTSVMMNFAPPAKKCSSETLSPTPGALLQIGSPQNSTLYYSFCRIALAKSWRGDLQCREQG